MSQSPSGRNVALWSLTIKSPTLTLKTKVDPNSTVSVCCERFKKKFPEDTANFALFVEGPKNFLRLDEESMIGSFEELKQGGEVLFCEKDFKGNKQKAVQVCIGKRGQTPVNTSQDDLLKPISSNDNAEAKKEKRRETKVFEKFFADAVVQCKNILLEIKNLLAMLENQTNEEVIFETAKKTAQITIELVSLVSGQTELTSHPQFVFIVERSKEVRSKLLSFLQALRSAAANPLDFMSKQTAINKSQDVVAIVKDFIKLMDSFDQDDEEVAEETANTILKHSKQLSDSVKILTESVVKKDHTLFVATTRTLVGVMNELLSIEEKLDLGLYWEMKNMTYNFVTASRFAILNPSDPGSQNHFRQCTSTMEEVLNKFLRACCSKSKEMNSILGSKIAELLRPAKKFNSAEEEKQYRVKKMVTNRILHILRTKFPAFEQQWQQQAPYEVDEIVEQMVNEMDVIGTLKAPPSEEDETLKELQKLNALQSSSDWQSMARKMRQLNTSASTRKLVVSDSIDLPQHINNVSPLISDATLEILLIIQESASDTATLDESKRKVLTTTVESFLNLLKKTLFLCKSRLKTAAPAQSPRDTSKRATTKTWKLTVEFQEKDTLYKKGILLDVNLYTDDALKEIVSRFPIDSQRDYALFIKDSNTVMQHSKRLYEYPQLATERAPLELKVLDPEGSELKKIIGATLDAIINQIDETNSVGRVQADTVSVLSATSNEVTDNYMSLKFQIEELLKNAISNYCSGFRALVAQFLATLQILNSAKDKDYSVLLQVTSMGKQIIAILSSLLDTFETYFYVRTGDNRQQGALSQSATHPDLTILLGSFATEDFIWNDDPIPAVYDGNKLKAGTLNQIIKILTSDENVDSEFLGAFMLTYRSFITPFAFLQKLLQRFNVPKGKLEKKKLMQIRLKVGIVLKYWIEHQFDDFDKRILVILTSMIDLMQQDDDLQELATLLKKEFNKRLEEKTKQKALAMEVPTDLKLKTNGLSVAELFLQLNESEIARQLTLIDFNFFTKIKRSEFLNQAWNNEKLKHQSPNILAMISRSNKLSFWVASLILWFPNKKERANVLSKLIAVAEHLLEIRNFHTLMGIVAGLSMTMVSRLTETWNEIDAKASEFFKKAQTLLSPMSSFKNYRQELAAVSSKGAVLPYLGTFLADLSFTEAGNPDTVPPHNLINWSKRVLVAKFVAQINLLQQNGFIFPVVEPIYTFLVELPCLDERELYDLSLLREPRKK